MITEKLKELKNILKKYPFNYTKIIKQDPKLLTFIEDNTPLLNDPMFKISTKVYWVLNGLKEFPKCKQCGKELRKNIVITHGYPTFCSSKCSTINETTIEKVKQTNLKRYGTEYTFQSNNVKEKIKQTNLEKYGCENPFQNENIKNKIKETNLEKYGVENPHQRDDIKEKIKQTNLEKYGCENPFQNENIKNKIKQTNLEKYGVENPSQNKYFQEKKIHTFLKRYGVENPLKDESIKTKIRETNLKRYGVENPFQNENIKNKIKETNLEKYGVENPFQYKDFKEKTIHTFLKRYGVENPSQYRKFRLKQQQKYTYDSRKFDSSPEIALYIYLKDNKIDFEYQPDVRFEYLDNKNKTHRYFPDFRIEDKYYEIKGDQFFNENNELIFLYGKNKNKVDIHKQQCMKDNNVIILRSKDYQKYLDYISEKYGKDYLKQFKNK